jgi:eukaryotic-like serine/threonine-protein kinase
MRVSRSAHCAALAVAMAVALGSSVIAVQPAAAAGGTFAQFHYAATRSGYVPSETTLRAANVASIKVIWAKSAGLGVNGTPIVAGGRVFAYAYTGRLTALRATTGAKIWSVQVGTGLDTTPAYWNGLVIAPSRDAKGSFVAAYDAASGARRWVSRVTSGPYDSITTPAVFGSALYFSVGKSVVALSASNGHMLWQTQATTAEYGDIYSPVAVSGEGKFVIATGEDGHVYAFDSATGNVLWDVVAGGGIYRGGPAIYTGIIYVAEGRGGDEGGGFDMVALQVSDGRILWRSYAGDDIHVTPAAGAGIVIVGSIDEGMAAFDARTGAVRWTAPYQGEVWGSPVLANGVVYVGTDQQLVAYAAANGSLLYAGQMDGADWSSPAVVSGRIYMGSGQGVVRVFGLP